MRDCIGAHWLRICDHTPFKNSLKIVRCEVYFDNLKKIFTEMIYFWLLYRCHRRLITIIISKVHGYALQEFYEIVRFGVYFDK